MTEIKRVYDVFRDKHGIPHKKIAAGSVVFRRIVFDTHSGVLIHGTGPRENGCCSWVIPTLGLDGVE